MWIIACNYNLVDYSLVNELIWFVQAVAEGRERIIVGSPGFGRPPALRLDSVHCYLWWNMPRLLYVYTKPTNQTDSHRRRRYYFNNVLSFGCNGPLYTRAFSSSFHRATYHIVYSLGAVSQQLPPQILWFTAMELVINVLIIREVSVWLKCS